MALFVAALAGFAVLAVEILGVHLLAPWFGTSALVWSQQIGLVLAAIACGGWAGGRLAARSNNPLGAAALALFLGGLCLAVGIFLLAPFAQALLPAGLTLDEAATVFQRGSFSAALLFFVPPVFLLSLLNPLLVQIRAQERGAGRAAGDISAAGTLGSLLGVLFSTFLAIPSIGVRHTFILTSVALLFAGGLLWQRRGRSALALFPLLLFLQRDPAWAANLPAGATVLAMRDSSYQHLRVVEFAGGERWLQMNEGLDSFQSIYQPSQKWPGGYYDLFALAPLYVSAPPFPLGKSLQAWVLGYGAGSTMEPLRHGAKGTELHVVGVELDPTVVELGQAWMPLPANTAEMVDVYAGADARSFFRAAPKDLDLVLLDAYTRQFEIPLHLVTQEFFHEVYQHLRPGGVFALNLGTTASVDAGLGFVGSILHGLQESFGTHVRMHRVPRSRNWVIFARKDAPFPDLEQLHALLPPGFPLAVGAACLPGQSRDLGPEHVQSEAFTDDRNPLQLEQSLEWWREAP